MPRALPRRIVPCRRNCRAPERAGVGIETVRFYERKGLLPDPERAENGYRVYDDTTLARLAGSRLRSMKLEGHF